jgi:hypothetical protein
MRVHLFAVGVLLAGAAVLLPAAAPPARPRDDKKIEKTIREVAGTAEFLRSLPKRFGTLVSVDVPRRTVRIRFDGDKNDYEWLLTEDAEIKIDGWWGRLDQLAPGERVWAWLKTNRKNEPVAIAMLADDTSQQDIHGFGVKVKTNGNGKIVLSPEQGPARVLDTAKAEAFAGERKVDPGSFAAGTKVFVRGKGNQALVLLDPAAFELRRAKQREGLRKRWLAEGLPGSAAFLHVFSGEMDLMLDHEAMRWGRSLQKGDQVTLVADPPIAAVVKSVQPWRERTQVRLVAKSIHLADLRLGQRLHLKMKAPPAEVEASPFPPDMGRPRAREERIEWFLASIYCTCGVRGDTCTGHFYTLASCNPNGCGQPNAMRRQIGKLIDQGLSDRQVFEKLLAEQGPGLLQPHLLP